MILKARDALRKALYRVPQGTSLAAAPFEDLSLVMPLIPEWLKQALLDGRFIVCPYQDWLDLPVEVNEQLEVVHR